MWVDVSDISVTPCYGSVTRKDVRALSDPRQEAIQCVHAVGQVQVDSPVWAGRDAQPASLASLVVDVCPPIGRRDGVYRALGKARSTASTCCLHHYSEAGQGLRTVSQKAIGPMRNPCRTVQQQSQQKQMASILR